MKQIFIPFAVTAMLATASFSPAEARITVAECEADYAAMLAEVETNRNASLDELNRQLRYTTDDEAAASLNAMIDQVWEVEETMLSHASNSYRDCVKYAKSGGS